MHQPATAPDWREGRRLRAWEPRRQGWKQADIARALGASEGAVSQWVELYNVPCQDLADLQDELQRAVKRPRHRRSVLRGCLRQCGYAP